MNKVNNNMKKQKYSDKPKWIDSVKNEAKYYSIIIQSNIKKATELAILISKNLLIPALIILMALTLLGYGITITNYIASVCLYLIIEEAKHFSKEMKK